MGGFEYTILRKPSEIEALDKAFNSFLEEAKNTFEKESWELDCAYKLCGVMYKSPDDAIFSNVDGSPYITVRNYCNEEEISELESGKKWFMWWFEIPWTWKIPHVVISLLVKHLKKENCEWFLNDAIGVSDKFDDSIQSIFKKAGLKTEYIK